MRAGGRDLQLSPKSIEKSTKNFIKPLFYTCFIPVLYLFYTCLT